MIDNYFRARLPIYLEPIVRLLKRGRIHPHWLTLGGLVLATASTVLIAYDHLLAALLLWWIGRACDCLDGLLARASGKTTALGSYLDIVCDMAAYSAVILGFWWRNPEFAGQGLLILFFYVLCITSALALGMQEQGLKLPPRDNRGLRLGAGLAEGGETSLMYSAFCLFPMQLDVLANLWMLLLLITVLSRTLHASRVLKMER